MSIDTHAGYNLDAHVQENGEGDIVPLQADSEPVDVSQYVLPELVSRTLERDVLEEMADKLGSYALARARLGLPEERGDTSADALTDRLDASLAPLSPKGKSTGKYVSGPQLSEETLPVVDQRLSAAEATRHHDQLDKKIHPVLHKNALRIARKNAERDGINPDLAERLYIEKHRE